ncbi:hypothetical protein [Cytobacillus oceanisediminis]|uniref:hypothetical protein n=1 Tax=Cytobacillus oceanisediminis TaxID=665099 RepID=UPI000FA6F925|nr:hypothetical protein [Cytobacillus oceanisediminis]MDK7667417.1 hypothetical protein [Cytobacillus oceanisediminis]
MMIEYILDMYRDNKILKEDVLVVFQANMKQLEKQYEEAFQNRVGKVVLNLVEKGVISRNEIDPIQLALVRKDN